MIEHVRSSVPARTNLVETTIPHAVPKRVEPVNACQPVDKLPHELMFQVFDFAGSGSAILPLAQVCNRWRDVAFSSPTLWSVIGARACLVPLFLQRSLGL